MDVTKIIIIVILVLTVVGIFGPSIVQKVAFDKIRLMFEHDDPDGVLAYLEKPLIKRCFPWFNREFMALNACMIKGDDEKASELLDHLLTAPVSTEQREAIVYKAFAFYMENKNYTEAGKLINEIKNFKDEQSIHECVRMYDILATKSSDYLDELLEEVESTTDTAVKFKDYLLIAAQYDNRHEKDKSNEFLNKANELASTAVKQAVDAANNGADADGVVSAAANVEDEDGAVAAAESGAEASAVEAESEDGVGEAADEAAGEAETDEAGEAAGEAATDEAGEIGEGE